ncbi:conserved Plasmodium protein, unknown function [Plasmodium knowlesi strain H]|uniref:BAR domain-containing protein n=3 Tax=Plasmodium knowlesi TaxID=5850 RepID=A0A5K1UVZ1_PLAKH|nr:conserved Plasmodium protein, unknown function [Plasmodium knowlesi strain H]OTN64386.1 Uncharacterized protein PKNOH_S130171600 [Plasmodium knowlesi]CAA9988884.1 conserved Plasmodium protein, unknown function [Plasmodium knowlesi strain H]SBO24723.1 conserved Plasmodium protein, unknown function [Plasmodium knowlesi strain H]SBO27993.1 conserved Plasmodium protein, unknown function [Plasmodium knowlesi strain H]VVS78358.1 conserved Plasmodium protein, unknown function [Plasmodium knowlesi |eukprot:XP_002261231.1 hypothetical protein, conserved in Plasmodium species [Plasmodium knowlesi strain H]
MNNMKAFVEKFRKSCDNLKQDDELYVEKKQLNSLHNYFSHSLLYLERLENVIKNINIMISDLNRSLMAFFENDVNLETIKHVSYILNTFNDVREQIISHIANSKMAANNTLENIKTLQNLCTRKKNLGASIEHYEKKIRKLQLVTPSNQKHLDKVIRNEAKLNMVKNDYLKYHDAIKKGFEIILENKTNKVLFDARKDLEILLCYFSLMNSVSLRLKDPLKELKYECLDGQKPKMPIDYNFFLEEEDDMNVFKEKKKGYSHSNSRQNVNNILSVRSMQSMENSQSIENVKSVENAQSMQNARIMQNTRSMQMSSGKNREHNYSSNSSVSINPFSRTPLPSLENKMCKKPVNLAALTEPDVKKESTFFNIKSLLGVADKSASSSASPKAKNYSSSNTPPAFPQ